MGGKLPPYTLETLFPPTPDRSADGPESPAGRGKVTPQLHPPSLSSGGWPEKTLIPEIVVPEFHYLL